MIRLLRYVPVVLTVIGVIRKNRRASAAKAARKGSRQS